MTERKPAGPAEQQVKRAKGVARETIGKLIGDDAEVTTGLIEQRQAKNAPCKIAKQEDRHGNNYEE